VWLTHFIKRMLPGEYCTKSVLTRPPQPTQRGPSPSACASPIARTPSAEASAGPNCGPPPLSSPLAEVQSPRLSSSALSPPRHRFPCLPGDGRRRLRIGHRCESGLSLEDCTVLAEMGLGRSETRPITDLRRSAARCSS
jgi:hypothetical protein